MTVADNREKPRPGVPRPLDSVSPGPDALEHEVARRVAAARDRWTRHAGLDLSSPAQYHRPVERPFTADERTSVTILIGGLTLRHEQLIQSALEAAGYNCLPLPPAGLRACYVGKQYGNNGVCNPAYFTVGNLVLWLQQREAEGVSRQELLDRYIFFTASGCGPCRFGTYEAEYRLALRNAGYDGFRVMTFRQDQGLKTSTGEPGFKFSLMLGLGAFNAFQMGDVLNDFAFAVRPFEIVPGSTDRLMAEATTVLARDLRARALRQPGEGFRPVVWKALGLLPKGPLVGSQIRNICRQVWGRPNHDAMAGCRSILSGIEVDRLRVKPVVKVTGEFWAQTTEGDGNFRMFEFLEREGAQVLAEPLSSWVMYMIYQGRAKLRYRLGMKVEGPSVAAGPRARAREALKALKKQSLLALADRLYRHRYDVLRRTLANVPHPLVDQMELARLAHPYYHSLSRGGEGHLEVAKNIYYSTQPGAHMVLSLKPFGCMPSTQSDGVQSSIVARFRDMLFVPIETAAEGELNAHSRVQMALVEAKSRAQAEFDGALERCGRTIAEIRRYVEAHPDLRNPFYPVPHRPGIVGEAANFVLHVGERMDRDPACRPAQRAAPSGLASAESAR
ncbi:MAG: activator of (R)-2-hydroxyglutaryl-CoA dehydratase [Acidobacteria bacterium]|nr:MAG: activator of (R)-2-hydroxyglutaryl-CoA dehydratase [Acidobacteriota bacterium]